MSNIPKDLRYTADHEYARKTDTTSLTAFSSPQTGYFGRSATGTTSGRGERFSFGAGAGRHSGATFSTSRAGVKWTVMPPVLPVR